MYLNRWQKGCVHIIHTTPNQTHICRLHDTHTIISIRLRPKHLWRKKAGWKQKCESPKKCLVNNSNLSSECVRSFHVYVLKFQMIELRTYDYVFTTKVPTEKEGYFHCPFQIYIYSTIYRVRLLMIFFLNFMGCVNRFSPLFAPFSTHAKNYLPIASKHKRHQPLASNILRWKSHNLLWMTKKKTTCIDSIWVMNYHQNMICYLVQPMSFIKKHRFTSGWALTAIRMLFLSLPLNDCLFQVWFDSLS